MEWMSDLEDRQLPYIGSAENCRPNRSLDFSTRHTPTTNFIPHAYNKNSSFINSNNRTVYPKEGNKYMLRKWRVSEHNQDMDRNIPINTLFR